MKNNVAVGIDKIKPVKLKKFDIHIFEYDASYGLTIEKFADALIKRYNANSCKTEYACFLAPDAKHVAVVKITNQETQTFVKDICGLFLVLSECVDEEGFDDDEEDFEDDGFPKRKKKTSHSGNCDVDESASYQVVSIKIEPTNSRHTTDGSKPRKAKNKTKK